MSEENTVAVVDSLLGLAVWMPGYLRKMRERGRYIIQNDAG